MKPLMIMFLLVLSLTGCDSSEVDFKAIKVFDGRFNIVLDTSEESTIKKLNVLFSNKIKDIHKAPNFKHLIELQVSGGTERWRYSTDGYAQKYSQEDQTIYMLTNKDQFNTLARIN